MLIRRAPLLVVALAFAGGVFSQSQPQQAQGIKANQNADSRAKREQASENKNAATYSSIVIETQAPAVKTEEERQRDAEKSAIEASEYMTLRGVHMKITDFFLAAFTGLLVFVTALLIAVGWVQARQLRRTVSAMEKEFITTHRPKLILRDAIALQFSEGPLKIVATIANVGGSRARIVESDLHAQFINQPVHLRGFPLQGGKNVIGPIALTAGEHWKVEFTSGMFKWPIPQGTELIFLGEITYIDDAGIKRHTAFYRWYDANQSRFYRSDDKALEPLDYSD